MTFVWKFVFPTIWICIFGVGVASVSIGEFRGGETELAPQSVRWIFLGFWVIAAAYLLWFSSRLCWVAVGGDSLFASNYFRRIRVPLSAISRVKQSYMSRPQTITIYLDRQTPLGGKVVFIPLGWPHFLSQHPITAELQETIARYH
jgi:hypothetical protein